MSQERKRSRKRQRFYRDFAHRTDRQARKVRSQVTVAERRARAHWKSYAQAKEAHMVGALVAHRLPAWKGTVLARFKDRDGREQLVLEEHGAFGVLHILEPNQVELIDGDQAEG